MTLPLIPIIPFAFFMIISIIYLNIFADSGKSEVIRKRKKQASGFSTNAFKEKFKEETNKRVAFNKREQIEILCLNAGFDWSYADYLLISIGFSAFLFLFFTVIVGNIFLGIVFGIFGYTLPGQVLGMIRTKRIEKLEQQIGPFMNMVVKRYEYTSDFEKAMTQTTKEFYGTEPLFTELSKTVSEMAVGVSITEALDNLAKRTSNLYLGLLSDYYKIAYTLGTDEVRKKLLNQAYQQYEENRKIKAFLKEQISEPVRDCYIMISSTPIFFLFGTFVIDGYLDFMLHQTLGQITVSVICVLILGIIWFVNKVVGAPLDKSSKKTNNPNQRKEK